MMDKCFQKCVSRPGSSLTGSEKSCLMNCRTSFSETLQIVQERVAKKLVRAAAAASARLCRLNLTPACACVLLCALTGYLTARGHEAHVGRHALSAVCADRGAVAGSTVATAPRVGHAVGLYTLGLVAANTVMAIRKLFLWVTYGGRQARIPGRHKHNHKN